MPDTPNRDPLRDLVEHLTADTSAKIKALLLPPRTGLIFGIGPLAYKISAINAGQMRFSAEFYGYVVPGQGIMRPGGRIETPDQTRAANPAPHEAGRNPNNITLNVHNGVIDGTAIFKPRSADNQNPVA